MLRFNRHSKQIISKALIFSLFMLFGMLASNQYTLYKRLGFMKSISDPNGQVLRISQVYAAVENLKAQLNEQELKRDELRSSATSSADLQSLLESDLQKYQILSGKTQVNGQGVRIKIDHVLVKTQIIDFINALKNIGGEAISVNGTRLVASTPLGQFENLEVYNIEVLGNKEVLYDSITRPGGAFDLIVNGSAEKMDNLTLPQVK